MALNSKNEVNTVSMPKMTVRDHGIIQLGKQGENEVLQVIWRGIVPEWEEKYGAGEFQLAVRRNQDTAPYIANIELDGGDIVWTITSAETARVGDGECELTYTVGDSIAKSQIWTITVCESLTGQEPVDPPEPAKNWVDVVIKSSSDAKQSATESAESARQSAESSMNAANSANEAHKSREAIENMEVSAVSLPPNSNATVEKDLVDGRVKLTFGIPRGEKDIFWLNTVSYSRIAETFDEILAAYKAGKSIWVRDTHSFSGGVLTAPEFIALPVYNETNIVGMVIVCGGSAYSSSDFIGSADGIMNVTYYINASPEKVTSTMLVNSCAALGDDYTPNESQLNGFAGDSTSASPVDHIHPAPFPDWTNNIGKALFVGNTNAAPSAAFEWRDVPNGDFTSKVGDFLRVAEVDSNNKPTKWATDSIGGIKEPMIVTFTLTNVNPFEFKADIPYEDIKEAANAGRIVYAFVPSPGPVFGQLTNASSSILRFNAFGNVGQMMNITMNSDSDITGVFIDSLYRLSDNSGGGDFDANDHRIMGVNEPTEPSDAATKNYVDKSLGLSDPSLGITSATVDQTIKVKAVDAEGKPTAWEAVDAAGDETWEKIAEIDVDVDAANDVSVWEYKNLPNYKELLYRKVSLVGSTETESGITVSINNSAMLYSGIWYAKKGGQYSGWGKILLFPFGWIHVCFPTAIAPTNQGHGGLLTTYNPIPFDGDGITSIRLSSHSTYKIAGGKLLLYGRK
jgi:hypothetical protein